MRNETVEEFLARGGKISKSTKVLGEKEQFPPIIVADMVKPEWVKMVLEKPNDLNRMFV